MDIQTQKALSMKQAEPTATTEMNRDEVGKELEKANILYGNPLSKSELSNVADGLYFDLIFGIEK
jgi:hypothetical protein